MLRKKSLAISSRSRSRRSSNKQRRLLLESLETRRLLAATGLTGGGSAHENMSPSLAVNYVVNIADGEFPGGCETSCLGEIRQFAGTFAPDGWAFANGQLLPISQHSALFSLLGTTYGGDGETSFALPDLRGRVPIHEGQGPGLSNYVLGQTGGVQDVTLTTSQLPSHNHTMPEGGTTDSTGGSSAHTNLQPFLTVNYIIALTGIFPSTDSGGVGGQTLGEVRMFAGNFAPEGWAFTDGQSLSVAQFPALFSILGTTYGGDNFTTTFDLPDLRGRAPVGIGQGAALSNITLGQQVGQESVTLTLPEIPSHDHNHSLPVAGDKTGTAGGGQAHANRHPALGIQHFVTTTGTFPGGLSDQTLGEIRMFAGTTDVGQEADGDLLLISQNTALFSLFGTNFGGDGETTFGVPDLSGRVAIHSGGNSAGPGLTARPLGSKVGTETHTLTVSELPSHSHFTPDYDFGDAPDSYGTLFASGGPLHAISTNLFIGTGVPDADTDGFANGVDDATIDDAADDDTEGSDDENGVASFPALTTLSTSYSLTVTVGNTTGGDANLFGWIDFDGNGTFDADESASVVVADNDTSAVLTWNDIGGAGPDIVDGDTFVRLRLSSGPEASSPGGLAGNGEVEDYPLNIGGNQSPSIMVGDLSYTEDQSSGDPVQIDAAATLNDADGDADWDGGTLVVQITANGEAGDEISIGNNAVGTINTSGTDLRNGTTVIGSLSTAGGIVTGNSVLTITFNSAATNALVQQVLQSIGYRTTSDTPGTTARTVTFTATDKNSASSNDTSTISVTANNDPATLTLNPTSVDLPEDTDTTSRIEVADITVTDPDGGTNNVTLGAGDTGFFEIDGQKLYLTDSVALDFETKPTISVDLHVDDATVSGSPDNIATFTINVTDVNEIPVVQTQNEVTEVPEQTLSASLRVADISVIDDALGSFGLTLSGVDQSFFEFQNGDTELHLKQGTVLDFETKPTYTVTVEADDPTIPGSPDSMVDLVIQVTDVAEDVKLVIDNGDAGFSDTGTWTQFPVGFDGDGQIAVGSTGADTATWTFENLTPGQFGVSITWQNGSDRSPSVPIVIRDGIGGPVVSTISLAQNVAPVATVVLGGRKFQLLDTVTIASDTLVLEMSNQDAMGHVVADAVLIEPFIPTPGVPEITVRSGGSDVADGSQFNFAGSTVGDVVKQEFTVRNDGAADLILQPITVTGSAFSLDSANFAPNQVLPTGGEVTFTIDLDTSVAGTFTGSLSFSNNDGDENPFDLTLGATVRIPGATTVLIDDGDPGFELTGNWANVPGFGFAADAKIITRNDSGTAKWTFNGLAAGDYAISTTWLPGNDRWDSVPYVIRDGDAGPILATVPVNQKVAPSGSVIGGRPFSSLGTVSLTGDTLVVEVSNAGAAGHAVADALQIEQSIPAPNAPEITVSQGTLTVVDDGSNSFGTAEQGDPAVSRTFTVENVGTADLVLEPLTLTGAGYSLTSPNFSPGQVVPPGDTVDFTIDLSTATVGNFDGNVSFVTNDGDENPFNFALSGTITTPLPVGINIIDDGDSGFSTVGGWGNVSGFGFGGDALAGNGFNGPETAEWVFTGLPVASSHEVSTTWLRGSDREAAVTYVIRDGVGGAVLGAVVVDQRVDPSGGVTEGGRPFQVLGTFTTTTGTLVVELSTAGSTKTVIADAVRLAQQ